MWLWYLAVLWLRIAHERSYFDDIHGHQKWGLVIFHEDEKHFKAARPRASG